MNKTFCPVCGGPAQIKRVTKLRTSKMPAIATLGAEVTYVSKHCFWLLLDDEELVISFSEFPWFKGATIEQLSEVERPTENHLYWPAIDIELSVESIRNPESFPLVSKSHTTLGAV